MNPPVQRGNLYLWLFAICLAVGTVFTILPATAAPGPGQSFTFLQPGFTQAIYGVAIMATNAEMGGPAFAPNGDPLVVECGGGGQPLIRFLGASTSTVNATLIHNFTTEASNAGCDLTNHPDGTLYSATTQGMVNLDANTGAQLRGPFGPPGELSGIAVDPQTGNLLYNSGHSVVVPGFGTIISVDRAFTTATTFSTVLFGTDLIGALAFDPTGTYLFVSSLSPSSLIVLNRSGALVQRVPMALPTAVTEPVGIAFHASAPVFVVTNNNDGTMTRFDFPGNNFTLPPVQTIFASGGFPGSLINVGPDGCLYVSQAQTRYDNGVVDDTQHHSLVQICDGFLSVTPTPTPSVTATPTTTATVTATPTSTATATPTSMATATSTSTATATPTSMATATSTATQTATATNTLVTATSTATPTPTFTPVPTQTQAPTPTLTPRPTATPCATNGDDVTQHGNDDDDRCERGNDDGGHHQKPTPTPHPRSGDDQGGGGHD